MPTTRAGRARAARDDRRVGGRARPGTPARLRPGRLRTAGLVLAAAAAAWPASAAQPDAGETAVDALRCWRRVSRGAVYAGERFTMTVSCRLVETDAARTRLDEAALEPATLDVAPFEVLSGERFDDVLAGPWRFSQRDYTLRLIPETGFGQDVEIPPLDLTYRIERRIGGEPALAGRELAYVLPAEPVRLLSLVPETADDIRDLPPAGFGAVQARDLRARLLALAAALFGVAAVGLALLGAVHAVRARRGAAAPSERRLSPALVAHRALDELLRVRRAVTGGGWTADAAARALTALRIAGAVALSRPVAQTATAAGEAPRDGQLRVRHGLLGRRTAVISAALTSADWRAPRRAGDGTPAGAEHRGRGPARPADGALTPADDAESRGGETESRNDDAPFADSPDNRDDDAGDLKRAMTVLTAFRYRRGGEAAPALDPDGLTRALDAAIARVARLRRRALAPVRQVEGWAAAARREWTRLTSEAPWKR